MPTRTEVIQSKIQQYNAQITGGQSAVIDNAIAKLAIAQLVDIVFSGGGSSTPTTSQIVSDGIDGSIDVNTILSRLQSIDTKALAQTDIVAAIQSATDIDALFVKLQSIDNKTPVIGSGIIATSQSVAIASDQRVPVAIATPQISSVVNSSIVTGGMAVTIPADSSRNYFEFQNTSASDLWINFGMVASAIAGIKVPSDATWFSPYGYKNASSVSVWGSTSGQKFGYITG